MSLTKIINAALESFKQNFKNICQNSINMLDTLDNDNFNLMTSALMEACLSRKLVLYKKSLFFTMNTVL